MIAIPALDLRDGACVQLVGGEYACERVRLADPRAVASRWAGLGFRRLHLVDLDAATGRGGNREVVQAILADRVLPTQVGGGLRSAEEVGGLLRDGANSAVVGTRALEEPAWIAELAGEFPGRIVVAADVRGRSAVVNGWARPLEGDFLALVRELSRLPLGGMLVTAVHREGRMEGADLPLMAEVVRHATVPVLAAGGIASLTELRGLAAIGCAGAVLGMALYTGALEPRAVAEEFAA